MPKRSVHRFPPPWKAIEIEGGWSVQDADGKPLGYFYGGRRHGSGNMPAQPRASAPDGREFRPFARATGFRKKRAHLRWGSQPELPQARRSLGLSLTLHPNVSTGRNGSAPVDPACSRSRSAASMIGVWGHNTSEFFIRTLHQFAPERARAGGPRSTAAAS